MRPATRLVCGILAFTLAACSNSPNNAKQPPDLSAAALRQVDAVLQAAIAHQQLPGLSVAVASNGRLIFARGYGSRNVGKRYAASGHTVYNIASTTKQFTVAAIMRLAERGLLRVDDRLSRYFPEYRYANRVTLREMLEHASGIPDYLDLSNVPANATTKQITAAIAHLPPVFPPGSRFQYSNSNYVILGTIVERLTHQSLNDVFRRWFFGPLGMRDSASGVAPWSLASGAMGYAYKNGRFVAIPQAVYGYGDGAIDSSAMDLMTWDQALIEDRVVNARSLREMTTPPRAQGEPLPGGYGFGLQVGTLFGRRELEHGGDNEGFKNDNAVFPDERFSLALLSNGNQFFPDWLLIRLFTIFYPPTAQAQRVFDAGAPAEDMRVTTRALHILQRMQTGIAKKSEILAPEIRGELPGSPKQMATRAGAVGSLRKAVYRGMSYRAGNRIYEYFLFYPRAVVAYFFVLTKHDAIYAALPVRAD